jgi:hypothetical protein
MSVNGTNLNNTKPLISFNNYSRIPAINKIIENSRVNGEKTFTKRSCLPSLPLQKSTSTNQYKKSISIYKQREIEYDKNLRCIKSNLFECKFKNISVNTKDLNSQLKKGNNLKILCKKNFVDNRNSNLYHNQYLTLFTKDENKNLNNLRERSRSASKKENIMNQLKTTPGEASILQQSEKSEIASEMKGKSMKDEEMVNMQIKNEFSTEIFEENNVNKLLTINDYTNTNNKIDGKMDCFKMNFNLIEANINKTDLQIFKDNNEEIINNLKQTNNLESNDRVIINHQIHKAKEESQYAIQKALNDSLDSIIKNTNENLLEMNDKTILELYMKDDIIFCGSQLNTDDKSTNNVSKQQTIEQLSNKSINELFNIDRLFENTIPLHSIQFPSTTDSKLEVYSRKNLNSKVYDVGYLNYKFFQENVNKISIGKFTLNYENMKLNKEFRAKFTQEEYRLLLSAFLRFDYGIGILEEFHNTEESNLNFLSGHEITERMRVKMIDWMIEVLNNYKCEESTYFLSVNLMDRYFKLCKKTLKPEDLHLIGICCMFISSKFCDIYPIKLKIVCEKISHNKFSSEEIKNMEDQIVKTLNYNLLIPTAWEFVNFFLEDIFYFIENNFMIVDDTLSEYIKGLCRNGTIEIKIDCLYYEKLKNTKKINQTVMSLLRNVVLYLTKMNCHDYQLISMKPSLNAASSLFVGLKICGQINREEYMNEYFFNKLVETSKHSENEILLNAQKILYNAQNFEKIFPNLENLKKIHFSHIMEIGYKENTMK